MASRVGELFEADGFPKICKHLHPLKFLALTTICLAKKLNELFSIF
jgi:hypothetical protein